MRKNHINKKTAIIRGHYDEESDTDEPAQLLIYRDGNIQKMDNAFGRENDYTILMHKSSNPIVTTNSKETYTDAPMSSQPAFGHHYELTVTGSDDRIDDQQQWTNMLVAAQNTVESLYERRHVKYVAIYADMSAFSCVPHLNVVTFKDVPLTITDEVKMANIAKNNLDVCHVCQMIKPGTEKNNHILEAGSFIAFCPWSPSFPYEFWIAPKRHGVRFLSISQKEIKDLALILTALLKGLATILDNAPYSLVLRLPPKNRIQLHWHIEVYPSTPVSPSLLHGFGISLCDVSPEEVVKRLSAAGRSELVSIVGVD